MRSCRALHEAALAAHDAGDYDTVETLSKELITAATAAGDTREEAWGLLFLGHARLHRDDEGAEQLYNRALELFTKLDERAGISRTLMSLGALALELHLDVAEARRFYDICVPMVRSMGDRPSLAVALGNLGEISRQEGDYTEAARLANESLALFRELGDSARTGWQLFNIAHLYSLRRDYGAAILNLRESFLELRKDGDARWMAIYFDIWIMVALELNEVETAALLLGFVDCFRHDNKAPRLRGMLPWFLPRMEQLSKALSADRLFALRSDGAAMTLDGANTLTQAISV